MTEVKFNKRELEQLKVIVQDHYLTFRKKYSSANRPYLKGLLKLVRKIKAAQKN